MRFDVDPRIYQEFEYDVPALQLCILGLQCAGAPQVSLCVLLTICYSGNFATFLDPSIGDLLLREFCYFFGL